MYPDKSHFEVGNIVPINGRDIDGHRFRNIDTVPIFYGIVEEITLMDGIGWSNTNVLYYQ